MNDKFLLMIQAALDTKGIKTDYNKLKQMFEKDPTKINTVMDMSATKTQINKFIKEYAPQLQKMFKDMGVNVNLKELESSMKNVFVESEKAVKSLANAEKQAYEMNKSFDKQRLADKKSLFLAEEQGYKTNSSLRQKEIAEQKKLYLDKQQAYKTNDNIDAKLVSERNKLNIATQQAYKTNNKLNDSMSVTKTRAEGAGKGFSAYTKSLKPEALKKYASEIRDISNLMSKAAETGNKTDYSKASASIGKFKSEMKNAGMETATFSQVLKHNIGALSEWMIIGNVVAGTIRQFKSALVNIKEVDTLLTEISKTSNLTGKELKSLGISAYDSASKYGSTIQSYLEGVKEMSRGNTKDVASGLAEMSILAQSAGDMTAELANEYIVATNAAFKLNGEISKINDVLDSQNQISNRNQISMSKIAEATKIAGSQSANSGVAINQMTAAISTMGVVTQAEGERLGRSWKGILMNIQSVKGETDDGEIIDSKSLSKSEKAADDLGVSFKEMRNGILSLRDPMVVIKELSEAYSNLAEGDVRGANLISAIGGKVYHVIQKCVTRMNLIAGNPLEPCTTI